MHCLRKSVWLASAAAALPLVALGSSHREAPFITEHPKVDGTDFYMFRSYESGRDGYVTSDRELPAAAGRVRRSELFHARPERRLRHPHRQRWRRARGPDVPLPLQEPDPGPVAQHRQRRQHADGRRARDHDGARCHRPGSARSRRSERVRDLHGRAHSRRQPQFRPRVDERRGRRRRRRCSRSPSTTWATKSIPDYAAYAASHVYNVTHSGLPAGQAVRRPARRAVRRESRRGVRSREHQRGRRAERRARHHRRQEHDVADSRGADLLSQGRPGSRDRRLDDGKLAAGRRC